MKIIRNAALILGLLAILAAAIGFQPPAALAGPEGITLTPTEPAVTELTPTPTDPVSPPGGTPTPDDPGDKERKSEKRSTPTPLAPILPVTGETPPSAPWTDFGPFGLLLAGLLLGLTFGLLIRGGSRWLSRFLS
jgi:hypothetical protein